MAGSEIIGSAFLGVAVVVLGVAVWRRRESWLLAAVAAYVGVTIHIVEGHPALLATALTLPIALALVGLVRFVSERFAAQQ